MKEQEARPGPAKSFQDLIVWQKAHRLVLAVYACTSEFPKSEQYGLTSQMRRAAVSVPANIAEGFIKKSALDKSRFYNIAEGSVEELRYYFILASDLRYAKTSTLTILLEEVSKLLHAYKSKLS